jgi:hypothetical protein
MAAIGDFLGAIGVPGGGEPSGDARDWLALRPRGFRRATSSFGPDGVGVEEATRRSRRCRGFLLGGQRDVPARWTDANHHALTDRPLVTRNLTGARMGSATQGSRSRLIPSGHLPQATVSIPPSRSVAFTRRPRVRGPSKAPGLERVLQRELGALAYGHNGIGRTPRRLWGVDVLPLPAPRRSISAVLARGEPGSRRSEISLPPQSPVWLLESGLTPGSRARATTLTARRTRPHHEESALAFWPGEFSQVRGQWPHQVRRGQHRQQSLFQLLFSIGARRPSVLIERRGHSERHSCSPDRAPGAAPPGPSSWQTEDPAASPAGSGPDSWTPPPTLQTPTSSRPSPAIIKRPPPTSRRRPELDRLASAPVPAGHREDQPGPMDA